VYRLSGIFFVAIKGALPQMEIASEATRKWWLTWLSNELKQRARQMANRLARSVFSEDRTSGKKSNFRPADVRMIAMNVKDKKL